MVMGSFWISANALFCISQALGLTPQGLITSAMFSAYEHHTNKKNKLENKFSTPIFPECSENVPKIHFRTLTFSNSFHGWNLKTVIYFS